MKTGIMRSIIVLVFIFFVLLSCRKSDRDLDTTIVISKDVLFAENLFDDLFKQIHSVIMQDSLKGNSANLSKVEVCIDTFTVKTGIGNGFPKELTVDFGVTETTCSDGKSRKGKLLAHFTDNYLVAGSKMTLTPENYYVNGTQIKGKRTVTSRGKNSDGIYSFEIKDENGEITNEIDNITWTSLKTYKWTIGQTSAKVGDDTFTITKLNANGTATKGTSYETEVINDIAYKLNCNWKTSGNLRISPSNLSPRDVNYGITSSVCDGEVVITLNGIQINHIIP